MKLIPLIGIAPQAQLFIIKVFDHTGLGVPSSFVINAINVAIEERAGGVDIDIINMSLGGATLFDGQDLTDKIVDFATTQGILSVSAAGNDGPASMTVGSPGSAQTGIAVAAAADPVQVRIRRDQQLGLGNGHLAFVSEHPQVIFFSSRGPTSDGRAKPDLIASGTFLLQAFAEGSSTGLAFGSGTSFSTPAVAGAAALLNSFAEGTSLATTPFDYKEALRGSADPGKIPFFSAEARGKGFLNVAGALAHLQGQATGGKLGNTEEVTFGNSLKPLRTIDIDDDDEFEKELTLSPGHIREFVFSIPNRARRVVEEIEIEVEVERLGTNPLKGHPIIGGNAMSIYTQSAKRTMLDAYIDKARVTGEATIKITDDATTITGGVLDVLDIRSHVIEPGFFKVIVDNDWRSFDKVRFELEINVDVERAPKPDLRLTGNIVQDGIIVLGPFDLNKGDIVELSWKHGWSRYPTSDVDVLLFDATTFALVEDFEGATLNAPERVLMGTDATVFIVLIGFEINPAGQREPWELRIFEADDDDDADDEHDD